MSQVATVTDDRNTQAHSNYRIGGKEVTNRFGTNVPMQPLNVLTARGAVMTHHGRRRIFIQN